MRYKQHFKKSIKAVPCSGAALILRIYMFCYFITLVTLDVPSVNVVAVATL